MGTLICLALLPYWQRIAGVNWVVLPTVLILSGCFLLIGWGMNHLGLRLIRRQVAEAAVWERAAMTAEAKGAFEQVKALFDSFWLSAPARQRNTAWIAMRLARFHLTQSRLTQEGLATVMAYLRLHPGDQAVATGWLETALRRETHTGEEQELAAVVSDALADNNGVQRLLMQFFLSHRRVDFEAMQTYRRLWRSAGELPEAMIRDLARALLGEAYIDDWALQVYLKAHYMGEHDCLEGIAAGLHCLRPNVDNRDDLALAREIVSGLDETQRLSLRRKFAPPRVIPSAREEEARDLPRGAAQRMAADRMMGAGRGIASVLVSTWQLLMECLRKILGVAKAMHRAVSALWRHSPEVRRAASTLWQQSPKFSRAASTLWRQSPQVRRATAVAVLVAIGGILAFAGWRWWGHASQPQPAVITATTDEIRTASPPTTDPFTIQVAAYLQPEDAQRFVDRLKRNQIEAFWSKAVSAKRIWYQVKVSHFATKDEAVRYGEMLKTKGLIDDFYVANYLKDR